MTNRKAVLRALGVAVLAALILPIFFGEAPTRTDREGGDAWRNWIYDFQTIIGGALALAAAWWTVRTMETTEAAAAVRHAQQMDLTLRRDRLAVERAVYPQTIGLNGAAQQLEELKRRILSVNTYQGQIETIVVECWLLDYLCEDLLEVLNREQLMEGSRLFDGNLAYKLHWLREQIEAVEAEIEGISEHIRYMGAKGVLRIDGVRERLDSCYGRLIAIPEEIPVIIDLMHDAAEYYEVLK
ncbi:hypothetical protein GOB43_29855 [Sinorhizobium meliloti]|uniref:AzlD domain-containing protein n=1 Tax=Rhizobium meliloti TaxID=382 RepID=UPI000FDA81DF|nr:AzlD domain-containing protein [Sinorhizobium meliloti]MDW9409245.1 hypothetical protein [Sinorhizobium meliloti]MDW9442206.1 hypothetical protein [Sinorhizobium meliloti]MDW9454401.1 hypothetical protein [Sinorhizobium meliloti]MDW9468262.1 hypothetical protein [Sinorhizobium meliloti]MDW9501075.1 hypothetical protein [Sinorhizobium meliloti]